MVCDSGEAPNQKQISMQESILQKWVTRIGLRHQGVLLTGLRGCDGAIKEDATKPILREMRGLILVPFDPRELQFDKGFMTGYPSETAIAGFEQLCKSLDHYPTHFLFHFIHAVEIIGYHHPEEGVRKVYWMRYIKLCKRLHMHGESKEECDARLTEDRIESGTVEA